MMSRLPDLVRDSRLRTKFRDSIIIHSYLEIDEIGGRFSREEYWKWERYLGRGGFGQVQLQRCVAKGAKRDSLRAVKIINKPLDSSGSLDFNRELETIAKFSNDRYKRWFVKSFGWFEDPTSMFVTMEYCCHGDLHHYLRRKCSVPAGEVQQLAYQMLEGLDQMHQNDFAHRDLKPGNILIKSMPPEEKWWIVLADFGISKRADESNGPTTAIKGTATFMAPELLRYLDQYKLKSIADFKAADMWALGEIIFQMLTGETTFQNPVELMRYCFGQREFPSNRLPISAADGGHELVTSLMMVLPQDRVTTTQCIQHRWMELLIEDEFTTPGLEQSTPLVPEIFPDELASARWSRLSELEHKPTQTTAQWRPEKPVNSNYSSVRQTRLRSTSMNPSSQHYPNADQGSLNLAKTALVQTLKDHSDAVLHVAFSPDGKQLASASGDKTVRLWDARSGKLVLTLEGHLAGVWHVAFSPNGKRLTSVSWDNTVRLWDARSGKLVLVQALESDLGKLDHKVSPNGVNYVAFSPDGKRLASALWEGTVQLWDARSEKPVLVQTFQGHSAEINHVAFSPDGKQLVSASRDKTVRLWDVRSGKLVMMLNVAGIWHVAFSLDGKQLASASRDNTVRLWDARSGKSMLVQTLKGPLAWVNHVAFSPDSKQLASASSDEMVRLWDAGSGKLVQTLEGHSAGVWHVAFSPDGKWLASASWDNTVRLWDTWSVKC